MVITLLALGVFAASSAFAANAVRISQVYGGGGGSSTAYNSDYVELFNSSCVPVAIGGWLIEYGSATGNWGSSASNIATIPAGATIPACGYYLIQVGSAGTAGSPLPITPDFTNTAGPSMGQASGKVALFNAVNTNVACGSEIAGTLVDKVAFGTSNCWEGTAAVAVLTNATTAVRKLAGMTDTDQNSTDFVLPNPASLTVTIHNSSSGLNPDCVAACTPTTGACCLRNVSEGACVVVTPAECDLQGGVFLGLGHACNAGECAVPTTKTTWGQVKSIYR